MKDLTKGSIYKTFLLFAIPLIISGFLSQAYTIIDAMIAGRILSSDALAAIGSTSALVEFLSAIFWGYGVGYSIYLARLFGSKDYKRLKKAIYVNYPLMMLMIVLMSIVAIALKNPIFDMLDIDYSIRDGASVYFSIYMLGFGILIMNTNGVYIMNALGSSSYPLFMSILSTVLHIAGNLFAVKVLKWGVGGIAVSTVISAAVVDLCYLFEIKKCLRIMGVDKYKVKFDLKPIKMAFAYSMPTMLQQMLMYFATLLISPLVNGVGSAASAAYVICMRIYSINSNIYQNSSKTVSNYIAQSMGAGKYGNIRRGLRVGFLQAMVFVLPILLFCVLNAKWCCSIFLSSDSDPNVLEMSMVFVRFYMPFILFNLVNNLFHSFYRGVAAMKYLVIATLIGSISRIAATFIAVKFYAMNGVYIGWVISWIVECVFSILVYFSGAWKPKEVRSFEKTLSI